MAAPRAFAQGQHEHEALSMGHPGLPRELARPQDALAAHAEGPAAVPAEVALFAVLRPALLHDRDGPAARAAHDFIGGAGRIINAVLLTAIMSQWRHSYVNYGLTEPKISHDQGGFHVMIES